MKRWLQWPYCQCPCWQQQSEGREGAHPPAPRTPSTSVGPPRHLSWRSYKDNFVSKACRKLNVGQSSRSAVGVTADIQRCSWRQSSTQHWAAWKGWLSLSSSLNAEWWSHRSAFEGRCWWQPSSAAHVKRGSTKCLQGKQNRSCKNKTEEKIVSPGRVRNWLVPVANSLTSTLLDFLRSLTKAGMPSQFLMAILLLWSLP